MKFYGKITVNRFAEDTWNPETTYRSTQSTLRRKASNPRRRISQRSLTDKCSFSWVQSWDNETREYTGKDLRWIPWSSVMTYTQDNGVEVGYSSRSSERMSGETIEQEGYKYGKSVGYRVDLDVYWKLSDVQ